MPLLALLILACQVICGVHIIRKQQHLGWLCLVILLPVLGSLIYFFGVMWPEIKRNKHTQKLNQSIKNQVFPEHRLQTLEEAFLRTPSQQNRLLLADEMLRLNRASSAITLYQHALQGADKHAPDVLLSLARAYFVQHRFQDCKNTLEDLIEHNPNFRSNDGHLLYARSLSALKQWPEAEHEFTALLHNYSGPQARYHYAQMLLEANQPAAAREQLLQIEHEAMQAGQSYQNLHKDCLTQTRQGLESL